MLLRGGIRFAEWFGAVVAGVALLAGGLFWATSGGPTSLDWLAPYVAAIFANAEPGLAARVDHTLINIGEGPRLEIIAQGVHIRRIDGNAELTLPRVSLSLSPDAALHGVIAPTRISLFQPQLRLLRTADGSFHLALESEQAVAGDWAETLLRDIAQPSDRQGAFDYLSEIEVRDAAFTVEDQSLGVTWAAKRADATLFRRDDGVAGDVTLQVDRGGRAADLHGEFHYEAAQNRVVTSVSFDDLRPAMFAAAAPGLKPLGYFDLPIGGQVSAAIDTQSLRLTDFWGDLRLGEGRIVEAHLAHGELPVTSGSMRLVYDPVATRLDLEQLSLEMPGAPGPKLTLRATAPNFDLLSAKPLAFSGHLSVWDLTVADLERVWPADIAVHAREWVTQHLKEGTLTGSDIDFAGAMTMQADRGSAVVLDAVNGALTYRDAAVEYLRPLTPVRNIEGTATFDRTRFDLYPTGGVVRDVRATGGVVRLTKLDTDNEEATVDVSLKGPLAEILGELDVKPLRYAHALDIDPAHVGGQAEGSVHFHLPMKKGVRFSQVDYGAHAKLDSIDIGRVFFNRDLSAGDLTLEVDRGALKVSGGARLSAVPLHLDWIENFSGDPVRSRYKLIGVFDDAARHQLGFDLLPHLVTGPVGVDMVFSRQRSGAANSEIRLDLTEAALDLPKLGWKKPPGQTAGAQLTIMARDGEPTTFENVRLQAPGLDTTFDVTLTGGEADAKIARADIRRMVVGKTDLAATIARREEGGWKIALHGKSLDATSLVDELAQAPKGATAAEPPMVIEADLDRVLLGPERAASAVHARLVSDGVHWQTASIDAAPAEGANLSLRLGGTVGDRNLVLTTDNFGALLRLLDISSKVSGGKLLVSGRVEDRGARRVLRGKLDGSDYRVVDTPAFARLLSLASFTGPSALLSGQGIPFNRLQGDFVLDNGLIDLRNARAYGEAMGITASGRFDYLNNNIDVAGTIVPAYLINSLIGKIPVVGDLLLGGKGQGIFGANYHVAGTMAEPGVSVNPLSAFAPGFLRRLFLFEAWTPTPSPASRNSVDHNGG